MARRLVPVLLLLLLLPLAATSAPARAQPAPSACLVAAQAATTRIGSPYSQGGYHPADPVDSFGQPLSRVGPDSFDCSGLVWWAYQQAGIDPGWTTYQQVNSGQQIGCSLADFAGTNTTCWAPGDLLFLRYSDGQHVSLYIGDGLVVDCYSHATGCILHDPSRDEFYHNHWWQGRRIASGCAGEVVTGGGNPYTDLLPDAPVGNAPLYSLLPDVLGYVDFRTPICGECVAGQDRAWLTVPPASDAPPWPSWDDFADFRSVDIWGVELPYIIPTPLNAWIKLFRWINWQLQRSIIWLICQMLYMLALLANILTGVVNALLYVLNTIVKIIVFVWLQVTQWAWSLWSWFNVVIDFFDWLAVIMVSIGAFALELQEITWLLFWQIGDVIMLIFDIGMILVNLVSYMGALALGVMFDLMSAMQGTTTPTQLSAYDGHGVYYLLRGILDALHDSSIGWVLYLAYALVNVAFFMWLVKVLPSKGTGE